VSPACCGPRKQGIHFCLFVWLLHWQLAAHDRPHDFDEELDRQDGDLFSDTSSIMSTTTRSKTSRSTSSSKNSKQSVSLCIERRIS
jgi:hypothetical protein